MTHCRSFSELAPMDRPNDPTLEGITANVKLLLKLIQEHNEAANKDEDGRRPHRVAGMITILDDLKSRVEKSQVSIRKAQFRRCNTELRRTNVNKDKKPQDPIHEENEKLRRELYASVAVRKSVENMFSSLGKEKEIMSTELARKTHEMKELEEHLNDLKAQNEKLLAKVQACAADHKEKLGSVRGGQVNAALQERNKLLGEQLLRSLEGYRSLKCKLRETMEVSTRMRKKMGEIAQDVTGGLDRIHDFRERIAGEEDVKMVDIENELSSLERMFRCFEGKVKTSTPERGDCVDLKADMPDKKTRSCLIRT
ncbi:hypothetical protein MRB53_018846 [Persea americana]|uniref:Uncharacterized protein n=1 Tax=Persea americana TaxID=3435 RepID=A0ACC2MAH6_PERAE|nr:hypothetical protein MRB53_018846 [Persea americana]